MLITVRQPTSAVVRDGHYPTSMETRIRYIKIKKVIRTRGQREEIGGFDEVAIYFSKEEWDCLNKEEKEMYKEVMMDNYQTLQSLGRIIEKPSIISMI
ncbi:zinc finger protein 566-like, partial [Mantella aurantiaca]